MKVRVIEGVEDPCEMIQLEATSSNEVALLKRLFDEGVRVVSGGNWKVTLCSPKLAGLRAYYLNSFEENFIHKALVDTYIDDRTLSVLLKKLSQGPEGDQV